MNYCTLYNNTERLAKYISFAESRPSVKCCWLWTRRGHHHLLLPSHPPHPLDSGTSSVPHRPVINTGGSGPTNLLPARPSLGQGWRSPCGPRGSWAASTPATHHVHGVAALYSLCVSLLCSQCVYGCFTLTKKKIKFSSYIRKFRMEQLLSNIWLTASLYMVKHLRISSYIRKPFLEYDIATDPLWISLYLRKIFFYFLSV